MSDGLGKNPHEGLPVCPPGCRYSGEAKRAVLRGPGLKAIGLGLLVSGGVHLSAMAALLPQEQVLIAGNGGGEVVRFGNWFEDLVEGGMPGDPEGIDPVSPEEMSAALAPVEPAPVTDLAETATPIEPVAPEMAMPVEPQPLEAEPEAVAEAPVEIPPLDAAPVVTAGIPPAMPETSAAQPLETALAPATIAPADIVMAAAPATLVPTVAAIVPSAPAPDAEALDPAETSEPSPYETVEANDEPEVEVQTADARSPRAPERPDPAELERRRTAAATPPAPEQPRRQAQTQPRAQQPAAPSGQSRARGDGVSTQAGNSDVNARRGSADGDGDVGATERGRGGGDGPAGNAAVTNYPGQVMRRITRTRQERVSVRGTAVVAFSVSGNGGLASVRLARSSGQPRLDEAALNHIRRSAPFPPPPRGAQTNFSFEFVGR